MIKANELMRYGELLSVRQSLARKESPLDDYKSYAGSVICPQDITLLRNLVRNSSSSDEAGSVALVLFTRGGVGNMTCEIRPWFECSNTDDLTILESGSLVLAQSVRHLLDGTALRCLIEFASQHDARIELDRLFEEIPHNEIGALLRSTREQQIESLLHKAGDAPSNRMLWLLRTYAANSTVRQYLNRFAIAGRVASCVSLAVFGDILDWSLFDLAQPTSDFERRCLINAALDNIARGADSLGLKSSLYYRSLSSAEWLEMEQGFNVLETNA